MHYNPLLYSAPSRFSFTSILNNAQKTLNIINQTLPIVKEVKPIVKNARTLFTVAKGFSNYNNNQNIDNKNTTTDKPSDYIRENNSNNGLNFFI